MHPEAWLHKLPDSLSYEEGSLLEPLSVALAGIERSGLKIGDSVLVCGAGPIGVVSLLSARAAGAYPLIITDISQSRLDFAKKQVPQVKTVLVEKSDSPESVAQKTKAALGDELGFTLALECTGVESSVTTAVYASRFGGKVFIIGVGKDEMTIPFMTCSAREIDLQFQYRYHDTWPTAIRMLEAGYINVKPLVTHRFKLAEAVSALECASNPASGSIKTMILDDVEL